ncbi:hypothetical protein A2335_04275 [Candidatus Peregrinibacteria bacterium RIFOXYB2_FULL_32_7]|nr:MAG: hypothetical protein A2335_04275 [Candidatus Peregrinibacteria bacterium RIFOXYB2_FULL_32_7]
MKIGSSFNRAKLYCTSSPYLGRQTPVIFFGSRKVLLSGPCNGCHNECTEIHGSTGERKEFGNGHFLLTILKIGAKES